ncbi:hypothetical protein VTK56DRAFT_8526 [Thermocarpiscus australiensis]
MYAAFKYARKQYKNHQDKKARAQLSSPETGPEAPTHNAVQVEKTTAQASSANSQSPFALNEAGALNKPSADNSGGKDEKPNETPEQRAEKKRRRTYRLKLILGLFGPITLQALDTTIIASALKFIAEDFNQLTQLNWIITAFNLTAAAFLPCFAQLADVFGRHAALQTALVLITIGSALCTAAPAPHGFPLLLLGRALQGVGAAGIQICVRAILADRVSLGDYAKNWSVFALVSAVSFSIGPVVGGYLTQASWRWCFAVNLPVGVLSIVVVLWLLRGELVGPAEMERGEPGEDGDGDGRREIMDTSTRRGRFWARLATIDYGGQLLFLWGLGLVVLALTWGGAMYPWDSAAVLASIVIGGVLAIAWLVYEWAMVPGRLMARVFPMQRAMMPWQLLVQRDIGLLFFISFANGVSMFSVMYFMDLYFTLVMGHSASSAGVALLYFLPGLGVGVYTAMFLINVWPRQTLPALLLGTTSSAVGITVLPWACQAERASTIYGMMALAGFGVGMNFNPGSLHGLAYFPGMTAPITCLISFAQPFGGTIALTIMSTVFNNRSGANHADPKTGIVWAYIAMIPIMWLAVLLTTFLGNVWVRKDGKHDVFHGAWLWNLLRGERLERVTMARVDDSDNVHEKAGAALKTVVPSIREARETRPDIERGNGQRETA